MTGTKKQDDLLIPAPKRRLEGHLALFLVPALFLHVLLYDWIRGHEGKFLRKAGSLVSVRLLNEMPPPPKPKLKPPPPPKIKTPAHAKGTPAPALLHVDQTKFHESKTPAQKEPSNLQEFEEPGGGSKYGNPGGIPGGKGPIENAPKLPPPKPVVPDRKNPAVLARCQPAYPEMERDQGIEGTVGIIVTVGPGGRIVEASVSASSGSAALDSAALESVRACWKFAPAVQNGEPVESRLTFSIVFKLQ